MGIWRYPYPIEGNIIATNYCMCIYYVISSTSLRYKGILALSYSVFKLRGGSTFCFLWQGGRGERSGSC